MLYVCNRGKINHATIVGYNVLVLDLTAALRLQKQSHGGKIIFTRFP